MQTKKIMENPIDTYILGGGEVPQSTGFGDYGDTVILNQSVPIIIEENVFIEDVAPSDTTPFFMDNPTPEVMDNPTENAPTENAPEDNPTKLNNPTQNFMSNANPFLIGIGIVVGLVILGDFFKSKSDV